MRTYCNAISVDSLSVSVLHFLMSNLHKAVITIVEINGFAMVLWFDRFLEEFYLSSNFAQKLCVGFTSNLHFICAESSQNMIRPLSDLEC